MTTSAKLAFGTTLKKGAVAIAELTGITGPSISAATVDVTSHDSPDTYREFIQGIREAGEVTLEGNFIPGNAGQVALLADLNDGSVDEYVITFPSGMATTWTFDAIVTAFATSAPFDEKASFTATMKLTGKPALSVTASAGLTTPFFSISESAVIVPDPAGDVYTYVATVLTGVESVTVTPTADAATAVIKVDGNVVTSGAASSPITLGDAGSVTEITITVKETSKTTVTYTIYLTRAAAA